MWKPPKTTKPHINHVPKIASSYLGRVAVKTRIDMSNTQHSFCKKSYNALALCGNKFLSCSSVLELLFTFKYIQGVLLEASIIIFYWCCTCKCLMGQKNFTNFKCSPKSRLCQLHLPSVFRTRTKCRPNWRHQRPRRCYWTRPQLSSNFQCFPMLSLSDSQI